ncbi:MAG: glycine cleavage system protein GcvH [Myxococcales bacterium]|nr:glycine cleavage system protein GcvH [Myxococcales bacterium]
MSEYSIPDDSLYTKHDEWLRVDGNITFVGITDYAQQQLGDIVFVELPAVGTTIQMDETYGVIESVKAVSDLYAPVTGEVIAINSELADNPERINEDCYGDGWLIQIDPSQDDERDELLDHNDYAKHLEERDA